MTDAAGILLGTLQRFREITLLQQTDFPKECGLSLEKALEGAFLQD